MRISPGFLHIAANPGRLRPDELMNDLSLSPNVLLRPAMQDAIFPTAAYVGGPAEVAYSRKPAAVYETLGRPCRRFSRGSARRSWSRESIARMKKYDIDFQDVFRGRDFCGERRSRASRGGIVRQRPRSNRAPSWSACGRR